MISLTRPACPNPNALDNNNYKHPTNKSALANASYDKCMYCESKISHIDFAHVEHIKPKAADKFPDLEFEWSNLGYACPKCNNNKSDKYYEETPYLDPYSEDPNEYLFAYGALIFQRNGNERGEITIRDIGLNRPELIEKRMERIVEIEKALNAAHRTVNQALKEAAINELEQDALPDKEYSVCVKSFLQSNETA